MPKAVGPQKVFGVRGPLRLDKFEMSNRFNLLWIVGWFWLGTDPGSNPPDQGPFDMQNIAHCTLHIVHCSLHTELTCCPSNILLGCSGFVQHV